MASTEAKTRVFSDVDYERRGKQATVLRVPQSRNDSGWGVVQIPITVIANGKGPTVLLTGGCTATNTNRRSRWPSSPARSSPAT